MKEYAKHIENVREIYGNGDSHFYEADTYPWGDNIRKFHDLKDWASVEKAEEYLEKYWLSEQEYLTRWQHCQSKIFINPNSWFPDMMVESGYLILPIMGGKVFWENSIEALNKSLIEIGETNIVCVQNTFNGTYSGLPFRLKYPVGIKWEEVNIGHTLTDDLLWGDDQDFYVFGENSDWGMYSATRTTFPMNIMIFKPHYSSIFLNHFKEIELQNELNIKYLPNEYKKRMPLSN